MIAIAAHAKGLAIGKKGKLPWHVPEDLRFFKQTTQRYENVVFGRTTFDSFEGMKLPGRNMYLLSQTSEAYECAGQFNSIEDVVEFSLHNDIVIGGGAKVYESFERYIKQFYITRIHKHIEGCDAFLFDYTRSFKCSEVILETADFSIELWVPKCN